MATTKFAQHGLVRLGYEVSGNNATPVLLLHGLLQDRVTMRPLIDALEDQATVVAMDIRGHGGSSAIHGVDMELQDVVDDAFAVLDAADVTDAVIVIGVELGAIIASAMQQARPDRVRETVLVNYPSGQMLDQDILADIADRAYKGQAEQAVTRWLDISWGSGWQKSVPKPRVAAARRSAQAIHPMLTALTRTDVHSQESLSLPHGMPFAEDVHVTTIIQMLQPLLGSE